MKRFILMFVPESDKKLKEDVKKITKDYLETADCENCDQKDDCPIFSLNITSASLGTSDSDNYDEIKSLIPIVQKQENPSTIIVVDSEKDVCYVYKAEGPIEDIKKNVLPQLLEYYEIVCQEYTFLGTVEDVRYLMTKHAMA